MRPETLQLFGRAGAAVSVRAISDPLLGCFGGKAASGPGIRIETPRLVLRPHDELDFPAFFEMMRDPEAFRFANRGPMNEEDAWMRMLRHVGHWSLKGWGLFAVEEKESGLLVGEIGFNRFRRGFGLDFDGVPEALWSIARWAQRRGYATEAARACLAWAETALGVDRTVCLIQPQNRASLRVAAKLGYLAFREIDYCGDPSLLMQRDRKACQLA